MDDTIPGWCLAQRIPSKVSDTQHDAARFGICPVSFHPAFAYLFLAMFLFLLFGMGLGILCHLCWNYITCFTFFLNAWAHSQGISLKPRKDFGLLKIIGDSGDFQSWTRCILVWTYSCQGQNVCLSQLLWVSMCNFTVVPRKQLPFLQLLASDFPTDIQTLQALACP